MISWDSLPADQRIQLRSVWGTNADPCISPESGLGMAMLVAVETCRRDLVWTQEMSSLLAMTTAEQSLYRELERDSTSRDGQILSSCFLWEAPAAVKLLLAETGPVQDSTYFNIGAIGDAPTINGLPSERMRHSARAALLCGIAHGGYTQLLNRWMIEDLQNVWGAEFKGIAIVGHAVNGELPQSTLEYILNIGFPLDLAAPFLLNAADCGNVEAVECLVTRGVNPNSSVRSMTPLLAACIGGHEAVAQALVRRGAEVNELKATTPLIAAISHGHSTIASFLLLSGADPNLCDKNGQSPLMVAVRMKCASVIDYLFRKGVDVNLTDNIKQSALMLAVKHRANDDIVRHMLEMGADPNRLTSTGEDALMWAVKHNNLKVAEYLVRHGAAKQTVRMPYTYLATVNNSKETLELLLDHSINDVNQATEKDETALTAAIASHDRAMESLIRRNGGVKPRKSSQPESKGKTKGKRRNLCLHILAFFLPFPTAPLESRLCSSSDC